MRSNSFYITEASYRVKRHCSKNTKHETFFFLKNLTNDHTLPHQIMPLPSSRALRASKNQLITMKLFVIRSLLLHSTLSVNKRRIFLGIPKNFNAKVMLGPPTSIFLTCAFSPPCSFLEAPLKGKRQPLDLFWTLRFYLISFILCFFFSCRKLRI